MFNPLSLRVAQDRIQDEIKRAERYRLAESVCKPPAGWSRRMGLALSEVLISTGEKLRERYDPGSCYESL